MLLGTKSGVRPSRNCELAKVQNMSINQVEARHPL